MKANENNMLRFIGGSDRKFIIPVYQRPYSWKKENCVQLMKDLKEVYIRGYESHFFGSIVFVSQNNGVCEEFTIIDGQQRITTISLLLLAIRNYVISHPELTFKIQPRKIMNAYLTDEYSDNEKKLKLVQGDDEAYEKLLLNQRPIENTSITVNYNYFYNEISNMSVQTIEQLNSAIAKLMIVSISLQPQNGDDPQLIFESLNSTGLDLEPADKIRNFVLMRMSSSEQNEFYKKYWKVLEDTVTQDEINKYIRYYLAVKTRKLYDEKKLYIEFKYYQEHSKKTIKMILVDMLEYADYYKIINNPNKKKRLYSDVLMRINGLEVKTCIPLVLDLFKANADGYLTEEEMCKSFEIIENYIVRREICDLPTNALNKVFVQLGAEIDKDVEDDNISYFEAFKKEILKRTGRSRFPNDHDFADRFTVYDLYNAKSSIKKYILERLENYENKEKVAVEQLVNEGKLTIEHIMPQTLTDEWRSMLGNTWELTHSKYKDTIGNLTLTAYNSDYSNSPFKAKKTMPGKGFNYSKLSLNDYVKACDVWTEYEIITRANLLFKKAVKIWWLPKLPYQSPKEEEEWVDWNEDFDATNKKIVQVIIMDRVIKTVDITAAYKVVHENLYDLDPTIYHHGEFSWFKETSEGLRKSHQIGTNAYVETNKSSQEKINTIKVIANLLELESHDIRFIIQDKKSNPKFDVGDESTYGNIPVGALAYELFSKLVECDAISEEEIQQLKTKEYTKMLFDDTDYPVVAERRDANKGNSNHIRYRKKPLIFKGKEIYITTQWFETNRADVIAWYKKHI